MYKFICSIICVALVPFFAFSQTSQEFLNNCIAYQSFQDEYCKSTTNYPDRCKFVESQIKDCANYIDSSGQAIAGNTAFSSPATPDITSGSTASVKNPSQLGYLPYNEEVSTNDSPPYVGLPVPTNNNYINNDGFENVAADCKIALRNMLQNCNASLMSAECQQNTVIKRQVCDGEVPRKAQETANISLTDSTSSTYSASSASNSIINTTSSLCQQNYDYIIQYCSNVSVNSDLYAQCKQVRGAYDQSCTQTKINSTLSNSTTQ